MRMVKRICLAIGFILLLTPTVYADESYNMVFPQAESGLIRDGMVLVFIEDMDAPRTSFMIDRIYGYKDTSGQQIIPYQYSHASLFNEGVAYVKAQGGDKYGYIDKTGELVISYRFDDARDFSEGLAAVRLGTQYGYIDKTGTFVIPRQFDKAGIFSEGLAMVEQGGKCGYIDKTGELVIPLIYDQADSFINGIARVLQNGHYTVIDKNMTALIPDQRSIPAIYDGGIITIHDDVSETGSILDSQGNTLVPHGQYAAFYAISEGLCGAKSMSDGKWGFVDYMTGELVIPFQFDYVYGFREGYAFVRKDDLYGVIDKTGQFVIPYTFTSTSLHFQEGLAWVSIAGGDAGFIALPGGAAQGVQSSVATEAGQPVKMIFNGQEKTLTLPVDMSDGRIMYPFRECLEMMGARVYWDGESRTAIGQLGGNTVAFIIDEPFYTVNGESFQMDGGAPYLRGGYTYIPIRYAAEALGFDVDWQNSTRTVAIKPLGVGTPLSQEPVNEQMDDAPSADPNPDPVSDSDGSTLAAAGEMIEAYMQQFKSGELDSTIHQWINVYTDEIQAVIMSKLKQMTYVVGEPVRVGDTITIPVTVTNFDIGDAMRSATKVTQEAYERSGFQGDSVFDFNENLLKQFKSYFARLSPKTRTIDATVTLEYGELVHRPYNGDFLSVLAGNLFEFTRELVEY